MHNFIYVSCLINIVCFCFTLVVLANKNAKKKYDYAFISFTLFVLIWQISLFSVLFVTTKAASALVSQKILEYSSILTAVSLYTFIFLFCEIKKREIYYFAFFLTSILILTSIFIPISLVPSPKLYFHFWATKGVLFLPYYFYLSTMYVIPFLFMGIQLYKNHNLKNFLLLLSLIICILGGFTNWFLWFDIMIPPFGMISLTIYSLILTYAITKHELMDVKLVISRIGSYTAIIGFLIFLLWTILFTDFSLIIKGIMLTLVAILFTLYGDKLREKLQTSAVRKWVTDWYNSDQLISRVLEKLVAALNRENVFDVIATEINETIKVEKTLTFLAIRNEETGEILAYQLIADDSNYGLDNPITLFALQQKEPLLFKLNDSHIATDIAKFSLRRSAALIPFWINDELDAFFLVDQKSSEAAYTEKDKMVFKMLSIQGSMALDRIRPFEENLKKLYDTERQLARSEKIASLAHLIQEYNHEIRTPLTAIQFCVAELFERNITDPAERAETYHTLIERIKRIGDIVDTTLRIHEAKKRDLVKVNLNDVIHNALNLFPPSGVTVILELGEIPVIEGDINDLEMMATNLIKNANEAMPNGGTLSIATYVKTEGNDLFVCMEVKDTGHGIEQKNLERIFEPFFSTKVTEGRGLGLSIVFRIVREHLGHVHVQSELNQGSTFLLKFKKL